MLRAGFAMPQPVTRCAVRSYRTLSPLPSPLRALRRSALCCTFRRLAPPRRYLALYPVEPGLSSPVDQVTLKRANQLTPERLSGRLRGGTLTGQSHKCKARHPMEHQFRPQISRRFCQQSHLCRDTCWQLPPIVASNWYFCGLRLLINVIQLPVITAHLPESDLTIKAQENFQ